MTFADVRVEYARDRIGPVILELVRDAVREQTRRLPPNAYAEVPSGSGTDWSPENLENLTQDVVLEQLLRQGQLEYAMSTATSLQAFKGVIALCARRQVRVRRRRTAVDNLVGRAIEVLSDAPYVVVGDGARATYGAPTTDAVSAPPTADDIRRAAQVVASLPRTAARGSSLVPLLLDRDGLCAAVSLIVTHLPERFGRKELRAIFELVFTDHALSNLLPSQSENDDGAALVAAPREVEEMLIVTETETALYQSLSDEQRFILQLKVAEVSDGDIAAQLRVSRPTAASRKNTMLAIVRTHLEGLTDEQQECVLDRVLLRIAVSAGAHHA